MDEHKRHVAAYKFFMRLARPIAKCKFNFTYEKVAVPQDRPILLLCNHNTDFDCIFAGLAADRQIYFVATEKITRMGLLGRLVMHFFKPILHSKGMQGMGTIKSIYRYIHQGYSVAMFPEGNRSFNGRTCPIPPATGRMARACGATLVTYRLTGGYFSSPRWGRGSRKGRLTGRVAHVYTPEALNGMSDDELKLAIEQDLYEDAYEEQTRQPVRYRGRCRAEGLESMLFLCPGCRRISGLRAKADRLFCGCGFEAEYDEYGYLQAADGSRHTLTDLDEAQRRYMDELYEQLVQAEGCVAGQAAGSRAAVGQAAAEQTADGTLSPIFSDSVICETIAPDHSVAQRQAVRLSAYTDRFVIGDREIPFSSITGMAINQRNLLMVHFAGSESHYEMTGPLSYNALKYLYLFRAACGSRNGIL